jgi:hydroxymethylbilane synthase
MDVAVFVKELEQALLDKRIDMAVHSLKDVPTELPAGLHLAAVFERNDPRDTLVARVKLENLPAGSRIGTSSLRREIQLKRSRPDLVISGIRGNIDTRLRKFQSGEYDGVIIAAAALIRLGWKDKITEYLPLDKFLPQAGQGALVIESRSEDQDVSELVSVINHIPTWQSVMAERAFLQKLGGGCRAPIAALGWIESGTLKLKGLAASQDGKRILQSSEEGSPSLYQEVGIRLANHMLEMGAGDFIEEVRY